MNESKGIKTEKIARIWEMEEGFMVCNWDNKALTHYLFADASVAREWALGLGYEEIFWME